MHSPKRGCSNKPKALAIGIQRYHTKKTHNEKNNPPLLGTSGISNKQSNIICQRKTKLDDSMKKQDPPTHEIKPEDPIQM